MSLRCCHFARLSLRAVTSLSMADPFEFRKDGHLLGVLSGVSQLGAFIAYEKMQVTATGRARGYFDLKRGEIVHTPQSMLRQGTRVQLPLRDGMLCRILVARLARERKRPRRWTCFVSRTCRRSHTTNLMLSTLLGCTHAQSTAASAPTVTVMHA